eukprot:11299561-Alexandrium_andersonii.AAC.1
MVVPPRAGATLAREHALCVAWGCGCAFYVSHLGCLPACACTVAIWHMGVCPTAVASKSSQWVPGARSRGVPTHATMHIRQMPPPWMSEI